MERENRKTEHEKYNPDCFSSSELDSESDEKENYKYEHKYKTLIWTIKLPMTRSEKLMIFNVCTISMIKEFRF